jgi:hypothetical protein
MLGANYPADVLFFANELNNPFFILKSSARCLAFAPLNHNTLKCANAIRYRGRLVVSLFDEREELEVGFFHRVFWCDGLGAR